MCRCVQTRCPCACAPRSPRNLPTGSRSVPPLVLPSGDNFPDVELFPCTSSREGFITPLAGGRL